MKYDVEHFRKLMVSKDFNSIGKRFKDYCDYCKKQDNYKEKIKIMEMLVGSANQVSISNDQNKKDNLEQIISLCINAFINSDFEVEMFFEINNFSLNFQKELLIKLVNFTYEKSDVYNLIMPKYYLWVIKVANSNKSDWIPLIAEEISGVIDSTERLIFGSNFENNLLSIKITLLKCAYELGIYYMFHNKLYKCNLCFNFVLKYYIDDSRFYFGREQIRKYIIYIQKPKNNSGKLSQIYKDRNSNKNNNITLKNEAIFSTSKKSFKFTSTSLTQLTELEFYQNSIFKDKNSHLMERLKMDEGTLVELLEPSQLNILERNLIINCLENSSKVRSLECYINKFLSMKVIDNAKISRRLSILTFIQYMISSNFDDNEIKLKSMLMEISSIIINFDNINETEILLIVQILTLNYVNSLEHVNKFYNDFFDYLKDKKDMPIIVLLSEYSFLRDFTGMILNYKNKSEIVINNFYTGNNNYYNKGFNFFNDINKILFNPNINFISLLTSCLKIFDLLVLLQMIIIHYLNKVIEINICSSERQIKYMTYYIDYFNNTNNNILDVKYKITIINNVFNNNTNNLQRSFEVSYLVKLNQLILTLEELIQKYAFSKDLKCKNNSLFNGLITKRKCIINGFTVDLLENATQTSLKSLNFYNTNYDLFVEYFSKSVYNYTIYFYNKIVFRVKHSFFSKDLFNEYPDKKYFNYLTAMLTNNTSNVDLINYFKLANKYIENMFLFQYNSCNNKSLENLKLLRVNEDKLNINLIKLIHKSLYLEYLGNSIMEIDSSTSNIILQKLRDIVKTLSFHQYFKNSQYRRTFKLLNLIKFYDELCVEQQN